MSEKSKGLSNPTAPSSKHADIVVFKQLHCTVQKLCEAAEQPAGSEHSEGEDKCLRFLSPARVSSPGSSA